jgi:hypothetical protein
MYGPNASRHSWLRHALFRGIVLLAVIPAGCTTGRDFREAALPSLRTGVDAILDGLLDGIFAVIDPEPQGS